MPTFTIDEAESRGARVSASGGRIKTRTYEVYTDDPANTDGQSVIEALGAQLGIYIGVANPTYANAVVEEIDSGEPDKDDPGLWRPKVTYSEPAPQAGTMSGVSPPPSPPPPPPPPPSHPAPGGAEDHQPPHVKISVRRLEVFDLFDLDGEPVVNAAGDPLDGSPPRILPLTTITYTRRIVLAKWDQSLAKEWMGKVNEDEWRGYLADTLLIDGIDAEPKTERGFTYWELVFTILHDPRGWIPTKLRNSGHRAYRRGEPKIADNLVPVKDTSAVVLLNAQGERYKAGDDPPESTVLNFRFYERKPFAGL